AFFALLKSSAFNIENEFRRKMDTNVIEDMNGTEVGEDQILPIQEPQDPALATPLCSGSFLEPPKRRWRKPGREGAHVGSYMMKDKYVSLIRDRMALEIQQVVASGGYGLIYSAIDIATQSQVALKVVQCSYKKDHRLKWWGRGCLRE